MIDHNNKVIFIHIPKCAGTSIEYFFGIRPFYWKTPNYQTLTGWCDKRKIHLHHATPRELLETGLIEEKIWNSYTKFTIVRNPFTRAYSDYVWLNEYNAFNCSFEDFLLKRGKMTKILTNKQDKNYRGDHLYPQVDFLKIDGKIVVDNIIRFENLNEELEQFFKSNNIALKDIPHDKKSKKYFKHYSHFFSDDEVKLVEKLYKEDIEFLNYKFEDRRYQLSGLQRAIITLKKKII